MAGATDTTMRRLCAAHGAVCTVSEMVSAKALTMGRAQPDGMAAAARLTCDMRGTMPFD